MTVDDFFGDTSTRLLATTMAAAIFLAAAAAAAALKFVAHMRARRQKADNRRARVADLEWQLVTRVVESPTEVARQDTGAGRGSGRRRSSALQAPKVLDFLDAGDRVTATLAASALGRLARLLDHAVDRGLAVYDDQHLQQRFWRVASLLTGASVCVVTYSASLCCDTDWVLTAHLRHWSLTLDRELGKHALHRGYARSFEWPFQLLFVAPEHVVVSARHSRARVFRLPTLSEASDVPINGRVVVWHNTLAVAAHNSARLLVYAEGPDRPPVHIDRHVAQFVVTRSGALLMRTGSRVVDDTEVRFYAVTSVAQWLLPATWTKIVSQDAAARLDGWADYRAADAAVVPRADAAATPQVDAAVDDGKSAALDCFRRLGATIQPPAADTSAMDHWYAAPDRVRRRLERVHEACEQHLPMPVCALVDAYLRRRAAGMPPELAPAF